MTDIHPPLSRLGLIQYAAKFAEEGFDTWEAILHITESDLDHLGVKLGHRRILQREIAYARGVSVEQLSSPTRAHQLDDAHVTGTQDGAKADGQLENAPRGKRKYRRHPKNDENAPERPPSAYVIFSNKIREELKPRNLSFTEIAKRVGERWQSITEEEKGPHEKLAMEMKEKYHKEMNAYKLTEHHRTHQEYLADFKLKYSGNTDGKKPRLDQDDSRDSNGSNDSPIAQDNPTPTYLGNMTGEPRRRIDSMSSAEPRITPGGFPSPMSAHAGHIGGRGGLATIHNNRSSMSTSPSSPSVRRGSSSGPLPPAALLPRPSHESTADISSYSTTNQRMHRNSPYGDAPTYRSGSSGPSMDSRSIRQPDHPNSMDEPGHTSRPAPKLVHQGTSSSSSLSFGSGLSTVSTNPSSNFPSTKNVEDGDRPQLPPLSVTGLHKPSGNMADYALRPSQPSSSGTSNLGSHPNIYQSSYSGGSSSDLPSIGSFRNVTLQEAAEPHKIILPGQATDRRDSPLQGIAPVMPTLPPLSTITRDGHLQELGSRPDQDRLAFLADVARADHDRRSGP